METVFAGVLACMLQPSLSHSSLTSHHSILLITMIIIVITLTITSSTLSSSACPGEH
jgi:uncharacterized membrane protein